MTSSSAIVTNLYVGLVTMTESENFGGYIKINTDKFLTIIIIIVVVIVVINNIIIIIIIIIIIVVVVVVNIVIIIIIIIIIVVVVVNIVIIIIIIITIIIIIIIIIIVAVVVIIIFVVFIRPTCRDVLLYGAGVCLSVRPSVCLSVRLSTKLVNTIQTATRTVKLGTHTPYDKRTNPIDFQGQGSKVKFTSYTLLLNLVNTTQTEPFQLGLSNLVHILLMTRGRHRMIFKVRGQRSRSHAPHYCKTL